MQKAVICDCAVKATGQRFRLFMVLDMEEGSERDIDTLLPYFLPGAVNINIVWERILGLP